MRLLTVLPFLTFLTFLPLLSSFGPLLPSRLPPSSLPSSSHLHATIKTLSKPPRLPVWPVFPGIILNAIDLVNKDLAATAEDKLFGGRVAPMQFPDTTTSPFILLVHHRHRLNKYNPFNILSKLILPEGFPAHPHRGFETVTMCMKGGMEHRDSYGLKQSYGADTDTPTQWLSAGEGLLHEEMWSKSKDQELYQLWINLPRELQMSKPVISLVNNNQCPTETTATTAGGVATVTTVPRPPENAGASVLIRHVSLSGSKATVTLPIATDHATM